MEDFLNVKGRIFDIQKYSIHDGPGIRTIVFLKGCALRCRWCCNPESQSYDIQSMTVNGKEKIIGEDVTVAEVIKEVMKDRSYYRRSGGGLTLSGGECLLQHEFAKALLQAAKAEGINTAIETTSIADFDVIADMLPYIDLYMTDIKHINDAKHKEYTNQSNEKILENIRKVANTGTHVIIRTPVIPGFNDTPYEIGEIARFTKNLPNVTELHLLPYHRLGQDKYNGLNREYLLDGVQPPTDEKMRQLAIVASQYGLEVQIGG